MIIDIKDDFDLRKIADSGQAFRVAEINNGCFRFISGESILYIKDLGSNHFDIFGTTQKEWDDIWVPYFDLTRNYKKIRTAVPSDDKYMKQAAEYGEGLRILRQEPWEMLLTFITSQRKSIPAIKDSVERMCEKYGHLIKTDLEELYSFPTPSEMAHATEAELKDCKLGYRVSYILDAISRVNSGSLDLAKIDSLNDTDLFTTLKEVRGVGDKVSNCICLFAYARTSSAPVDTWIAKVIDNYYGGINPFPAYGEVAGIMQQYIFYYAQTHKDEF